MSEEQSGTATATSANGDNPYPEQVHAAGETPRVATEDASQQRFGRLESVQLRRYWQDEARDFTPWLAQEENLTLLGEAIGMSLELVATEQYVGAFRADIIARDEDAEVIIENQLDATDHKHLGQLMVYAANRGAGVIVWIARQVTDEYRKVIDWLNEKTDVSFFALEVELWRIGSSPVAPKFNVVCKPNEFARAVRSSGTGEIGETAQLQLEFWTGLLDAMSDRDFAFNTPSVGPHHWCNLRLGTSRGHISLTALRNGRLSCDLYMNGSSATAVYSQLEKQRNEIEAELDLRGQLDWQALPDRIACRIALYREMGSLDDRDQWPASYKWMLDSAEKFKAVFAQRLRSIELPNSPPDELEGTSATASSAAGTAASDTQ